MSKRAFEYRAASLGMIVCLLSNYLFRVCAVWCVTMFSSGAKQRVSFMM